MSVKPLCVDFRTGGARPAWAAPVSHGRFAFLEMADRRATRARRSSSVAEPVALDQHRTPSLRLLAAWEPVVVELRRMVDEPTFRIWLEPLHPHSLIGGVWRVGCRPNCRRWVQDRFGRVLLAAAGRDVMVVPCGELA
jgi:hypothetical protein